jgi:hypothetical protein
MLKKHLFPPRIFVDKITASIPLVGTGPHGLKFKFKTASAATWKVKKRVICNSAKCESKCERKSRQLRFRTPCIARVTKSPGKKKEKPSKNCRICPRKTKVGHVNKSCLY